MKTKTKIMAFVSLISLTLILLMVGVWALKTIDFTVGGNLSYVAPGVEATISKGTLTNGVWENAGDASTKMPQTQITKNDTEETLTTKFSYWQNLNILFNEAGDDVTISFTITNDMSSKDLAISVSSSYATADNATIFVNTSFVTLKPTKSQQFEITMSITDKTANASLTNFAVVFHMEMAEPAKDASEYSTLVFAVTDETEKTCSVTQNTNNMPTGDVEIPEYVKINGEEYAVTSVLGGYESYLGFGMNRNITSVSLPMTMKDVAGYAFLGCSSLTNVYIKDAVIFGTSAFLGTAVQYNVYDNASYLGSKTNPYLVLMSVKDSSITSCIIHSECEVIGDSAFRGSSLTGIVIPAKVRKIVGGSVTGAFTDLTTLKSVIIAKGAYREIDDYLFYNCSALTSITIPDSVTSIGSSVFSGCTGLTSITNPDSVTSIGTYAFYGCTGLTSITIPNSVVSIEFGVFKSCTSLTSISIPDSVTSIGDDAFYGCAGFTSITIPDSVTSIGNTAFQNCTKLATVNVKATKVPTGGTIMFSNCSSSLVIYVPTESVDAYKTATNWSMYASKIQGKDF